MKRYLFALVCLASCNQDSVVRLGNYEGTPDASTGDAAVPDTPSESQCQVLWSHDFGTVSSNAMVRRSGFVRLEDGDYALAGWSGLPTSERHSMIVKLSPTGDARWTKVYGTGVEEDMAYTIVPITNGLIACGWSAPDTDGFMCSAGRHCGICFRTDLEGTESWKRAYPGAAKDVFLANAATASPTGILLAGYTTDGDPWIDAMTQTVGLDGMPGAITTYKNDGEDAFADLVPVGDGTYLASGHAHSWRACQQPFVAHLGANSALLGQYDMGPCTVESPGNAKGDERGIAIAIEPLDGGHAVVVGRQWAGTDRQQAFVAEVSSLDTTPGEAWRKLYGGAGDDWFNAVLKLPDGFLLVGTISTETQGHDTYLVRTNLLGDKIWHQTFGGPGDQEGIGVLRAADGSILIAGNTSTGTIGDSDLFVMSIKDCL